MKPFKFFFYSPNAIDTGLRSSNQLSHTVFMRYIAISLNKPYDLPCFLVQMLISFNHINPKCLVFTIKVHLVSEHIWCEDYLVRSFYLKNLQVYTCAVNNILLLNVMSTLFRINEYMKKSLFATELKQLITGLQWSSCIRLKMNLLQDILPVAAMILIVHLREVSCT